MRDTNLTGGQDSMQKIIVETTPQAVERLNVFRATPFEFELTAPTLVATSVVGRPTVIDSRPAGITRTVENRSASLTTAPFAHHT